MANLLPLFVALDGRDVLLVGGGPVAAAKLAQLVAVGARVRVVAPVVAAEIDAAGVPVAKRAFEPGDLDDVWLVVAAATPDVNREVAREAEARRVFVNAVDDPANATAYLSGVIRRAGVTFAISTEGDAPALTALVREALDALLPADFQEWANEARKQRALWRRDAVPMAERRPLLLRALNGLYVGQRAKGEGHSAASPKLRPWPLVLSPSEALSPATGHVSLVGAGPGDPGLLTRKALARLRTADLVLFDALIDDRILRFARKAQRFFVGKRAGRHAFTQQTIHTVMIRAARRGRRVVRLKGGDPFVFGRGGEEALALGQAGVPYEIVPGVTSALATPALAGIPVTHRGLASAFFVVSGHDEAAFRTSVQNLRPEGVTLIVLMGLARSSALATTLVEIGWAATTPAAIVIDASGPGQHVWRGTLEQLAAGVDGATGAATGAAGTLVIGEVVNVAGGATAFERRYANNG